MEHDQEREKKKLKKHFRNITEMLNSHKPPEKKDLEACEKLIHKLSEQLSVIDGELVATAREAWKAINSKVTELFVIEKELRKQEQDLKEQIKELNDKVDKLERLVEQLMTKRDEQATRMKKLETSMRQVQQENEILKVCQIAFSIENIIVNTVLLKNRDQEYPIRSIKQMENILMARRLNQKYFASREEKLEAKQTWMKLQEELDWDEELGKQSLKNVKEERHGPAHPVVPPKEVKRLLQELEGKVSTFQTNKSFFTWCLERYEILWKKKDAEKLAKLDFEKKEDAEKLAKHDFED